MGGRGSQQKKRWLRRRKANIFARDGGRCVWCDRPVTPGVDASLDHVTPRSKGGDNTQQNLVLACVPCNQQRADRSAWDFLVERVGR